MQAAGPSGPQWTVLRNLKSASNIHSRAAHNTSEVFLVNTAQSGGPARTNYINPFMVKVTIYNILDALYQCWLLVSWQGSGHTLSVQSLPIWPASLPAWFLVLRTARGGRPWWSLALDLGVLPCLAGWSGQTRPDCHTFLILTQPGWQETQAMKSLHYITLHYIRQTNMILARRRCVVCWSAGKKLPVWWLAVACIWRLWRPEKIHVVVLASQTRQQPYRRSCFIIVW